MRGQVTDRGWWDLGDRDVWREIEREMEAWGGRYCVEWWRGHPEKRMKDDTEWGPHDWGNHWCDRQCDTAYQQEWEWVGGGLGWVREGGGVRDAGEVSKEWRVMVAGEEMCGSVTEGLSKRAMMRRAEEHVVRTVQGGREMWERVSWVLMGMRARSSYGGVELRARLARHMWGWLPTKQKLQQRGECEDGLCPLCGQEDGRGHAARGCTHQHVVKCRRELAEEMMVGMDKVKGVPRHLRQAIKCVWGLDEEGCMRDWEGMEWEQFEAVCRQVLQGVAGELRGDARSSRQ